MSHTPGPWWVEDSDHPMGEGREVYDGFGRTASVYGDPATAVANARLIACAPEMLDALKRIAHKQLWGDGSFSVAELCNSLIARAEGVTMEDEHDSQN